jgi:hypothetical protein
MVFRPLGLVAFLSLVPLAAGAATVRGTTTTQGGSTRLPGVEISISRVVGGRLAGTAVSDASGRFEIEHLEAGRYHVVARLTGFNDLAPAPITLVEGQTLEIDLDLTIASITEQVEVVGQAGVARTDSSASVEKINGQMNEFLPVAGDGYQALLPIMPGVVRAPDGRMSLKGARESQGALRVGSGYANDPSTGNFGVQLPGDSIDSVEVVPNPYAAEEGRFSSTVVRVETRSGGNRWKVLANGFVPLPCLKICDGGTMGVVSFVPRGWVGGPLVKDRLFLSQGIQYRFASVRVPGLPEGANHAVNHSLDAFTRLDASLSGAHALSVTGAFFGRRTENVGLGPFVSESVAPDFRFGGYSASITETASLSSTAVAESSVTATVYVGDTFGDGAQPDEFTVNGQQGNYFNTQHRRARVVQWAESITSLHGGPLGEHLIRAGLDVMWAGYSGDSRSNSVVIRRADGTTSQRIDFSGPAFQQAAGTDIAAFVQDQWRVSDPPGAGAPGGLRRRARPDEPLATPGICGRRDRSRRGCAARRRGHVLRTDAAQPRHVRLVRDGDPHPLRTRWHHARSARRELSPDDRLPAHGAKHDLEPRVRPPTRAVRVPQGGPPRAPRVGRGDAGASGNASCG